MPGGRPTALAPMQDVTDLPFMKLLGHFGPPDYFFTEYFRVTTTSSLEKHILDSILHHGTGRPIFAQLIGEELESMARTAKALQAYPVTGIDLNMGCPAPKIYKKNVGGGLLRDPDKVDRLLGTLRQACPGRFSVKMRLGFDNVEPLDPILDLIDKHEVDFLSLHGRTVKEMYRGEVHYDLIAHAKRRLTCPVFANGNISSARIAEEVLESTGCDGAMIGRGAIRNPWIFRQFRQLEAGETLYEPRLSDVRDYIERLWEATGRPGLPDLHHLNRMKKFLNFIGQGVDPAGEFLHLARRTREADAFFALCEEYLGGARASLPFASEPFPKVIARPNCET